MRPTQAEAGTVSPGQCSLPPGGETFAESSLRQAWLDVLANDLDDGVPAPGVTRFQEHLGRNLAALAQQLTDGSYHPSDLTEVAISKSDGGLRHLHVPAVRDRVVARALLTVVTPRIDPHLGHAAYAYRPGLGVAEAVEAVAAARDEGLRWALRTDVDDCFPTTPVEVARRRFEALVDDPLIVECVRRLLARKVRLEDGRLTQGAGLAQGCALSPLLSNLVLVDVDEALADRGFRVVRYADDLAVLVATREQAWEAARCASAVLKEWGMALGADKTAVMSFDDGFAFLGEDFGPRYPPVVARGVEEPDRKVVYAGVQGSRLRVTKGRLLVESEADVELLSVPVSQVQRLVTFGSVGVSAGVRDWAVSNDVDVVFASRRGAYQASLVAAGSGARVSRLRAQVKLSGSVEALPMARAIVAAKIRHQLVLLRRSAVVEVADLIGTAVGAMEGYARMLDECATTEEVMGLEGAAAAAYFPALGVLMPAELQFVLRSRQPPADLANSALSFLYTILLGECVTALYAAGLDPAFGVLHSDQDKRPSLALDLQEEFRPLVVDQVVLEAARQGRLRSEHARTEPNRPGIFLTKAGQRVLLEGYERRMLRATRGALPDFAGSWRRHLYRQAQRLRASIMEPGTPWTGLSWRP